MKNADFKPNYRLILMAMKHYSHRLLTQCLSVWLLKTERERGRREREAERVRHRDRVQAFLSAAATVTVALTVGDREREAERESKSLAIEHVEETPDSGSVGTERETGRETEGKKSYRSEPLIWHTARKHVVRKLLNQYIFTSISVTH